MISEVPPPPDEIEPEATTNPAPPVAEPVEIVESMSLPSGLTEDMLPTGKRPRTPNETRIAMTRIARELARDYRVTYGTTLKTDVMSIETFQRHLRRRWAPTQTRDPAMSLELQRHGALLSEIIARRLGARWVDVGPSEIGYWAMMVPPSTHIWPIGRVFRFFALGQKDRDLVAYFQELEARTKTRK
jgi:hypothetical protein